MADSQALLSAALITIINTEFASELITARSDKLHESMGLEGIEVGVSPLRSRSSVKNNAVKETFAQVQFYGIWEKLVDPAQQVDPGLVTGWADRFERAVESYQPASNVSTDFWYFEVVSTDFPDDPTGNKTRFVAEVKAVGDNTALTQR